MKPSKRVLARRRGASSAFGAALSVVLAALCGCAGAPAPIELDRIRLQLNWFHEAEFVGYYVARDKGFYEQAGLDVEIMEGPGGVQVHDALFSGRVDIGILDQANVINISPELESDLVALAAVYQMSPHVFIVMADSGMESPWDFPGRTIGIKTWGWSVIFRTVMRNLGMDPNSVEEAPAAADLEPFVRGDVDIWTGYAFSEPVELEFKGLEVRTFMAADYGFDAYAGIIIAAEEYVERNPDVVQRFIDATIRGWRYAMQNPGEAADIILRYDSNQDRDFQIRAVQKLVPLMHTGRQRLGWMDAERFRVALRQLGPEYENVRIRVDMSFLENAEAGASGRH